jgi:hypothetical protein
VFTLVCDECVTGHSDICVPEVTYALLEAVASAG